VALRSSTSIRRIGETGYTFVEVIVALAILSLGGGALVVGGLQLWNHVQKIHDQIERNARLADCERLFRATVAQIRAPYWTQPSIVESDGSFRISHYRGIAEKTVTMGVANERLIVEGDEGEHRERAGPLPDRSSPVDPTNGLREITVALPGGGRLSPLYDDDTIVGMRLTLDIGKEVVIEEPFGSVRLSPPD
jgi:prepilin-type N-terminal cleavage/methylation domain-containing protein